MNDAPTTVEQRISHKVLLYAAQRHPEKMNQYTVEDIVRREIKAEVEAMREAIREANEALFRLVGLGSLELPHRRDAALTLGESALAKLEPFITP